MVALCLRGLTIIEKYDISKYFCSNYLITLHKRVTVSDLHAIIAAYPLILIFLVFRDILFIFILPFESNLDLSWITMYIQDFMLSFI